MAPKTYISIERIQYLVLKYKTLNKCSLDEFKIFDNRLRMKREKKTTTTTKMNQIEHSVNIILDINYMFSLTSIRFKKLFDFYLSVCSIGKTEIKY